MIAPRQITASKRPLSAQVCASSGISNDPGRPEDLDRVGRRALRGQRALRAVEQGAGDRFVEARHDDGEAQAAGVVEGGAGGAGHRQASVRRAAPRLAAFLAALLGAGSAAGTGCATGASSRCPSLDCLVAR